MIEIRSRFDGRVLYAAETALDVRAAVMQAVAAKSSLYGADLHRASLYGADLHGADLREADLREADLRRANLHGADLSGADLHRASLYGADLYGADLHGADLHGADLYGADLHGADLREADLSGANLHGANLHRAGILHIDGLPSGSATLIPEPDGWVLQIGCWRGTITELREMIARDDGWPEAVGAQIVERRPMLAALADMADAWAAVNQLLLERVRKLHGTKTAVIV